MAHLAHQNMKFCSEERQEERTSDQNEIYLSLQMKRSTKFKETETYEKEDDPQQNDELPYLFK